MNPEQKLELALKIERYGADFIEAGFPASSPAEFEATRLLSQHLTETSFVSFVRATRGDVDTAVDAGGTTRHGIQVLATGSDIHLEHKRRITRDEAVAEVVDTVRYVKSLGIGHISVGIEDASRADLQFLRVLIENAVEAGAINLVVADTTGCCTPSSYGALIAQVRSWVPAHVTISTHCHDDLGLSLANALAGVLAGADEVQATLGGIGERAGNTAIEELAALLHYKREEFGIEVGIQLDQLYDAFVTLRDIIGMEAPRNKAIFGRYAFGTAAGVHQQGMLRDPRTYEYVEPSVFGRERSLLVTRHSGRSILRHVLSGLGYSVGDHDLDELYHTYIANWPGNDCEDLQALAARVGDGLRASASLEAK
jgi:2-isopropylmalate synthase